MTSILITHPDMSFYGGAELVITEFCRYLGDHQIQCDLLTSQVSPEIRSMTPKTNYICVKPSWNGRWQTGCEYSFWRYIKRNSEWDIINAHNYPSHLAAACSKIPTVWMCNEPPAYHISYEGIHRPMDLMKKMIITEDRWVVKNRIADIIVADQFNMDRVKRLYNRKSHIVPYGINYDFFSSGDARRVKEYYNLNDHFVLLQVGVFTPYKNQMASVRCLEGSLPHCPSMILILAGKGDNTYENQVREYIKTHHLIDHVIFTGHVSREEVRDLYHAADIAIFPVRSQGSWLSPFEALCSGTPVIVSPDITSSSIIREQKIGIVTDNYSEATAEMLKNYSEYKKIADQGKEWVRENLLWSKFCQSMYELCLSHSHR